MIHFKILGPIIVERDGSAITLNALMLRRLLAALLVHANRTVTIDALIAALWRDTAPPGCRKTIQVYVHRLRGFLGDPDPISREAGGYRLIVTPDAFDAARFKSLAGKARQLRDAGRPRDAADAFEQALELWRGPAYADVNEFPPISDEAVRLDEERLRVTSDYVETRLSLGEHEDLIPELASYIERHPYNEDLRRHLMLAMYRSGRQAEALEVFQKTRRILDHELGLRPGPELRRLQELILRNDPGLEPDVADQPKIVPRELPSEPARFTGRTEQLSTLDKALLAQSAHGVPLVLITGTGGVGKTALALHWAHSRSARFPDGQLFVDLRGYSAGSYVRPIEALTTFLRSLGVPPPQIPIDVGQAAAMYRSRLAGRRMLVVLDNAKSAEDVRLLLPGTPTCSVIVTSRDRLSGLVARNGATRAPLDLFSAEEAWSLIGNLVGRPDRWHMELAEACGFLPLAICIAAAHLLDNPYLPAHELVKRLNATGERRLEALTIIGDDTGAVRNTFALSYQAVPKHAQLVFRRVGLVSLPTFTSQTAMAVSNLPESECSKCIGAPCGRAPRKPGCPEPLCDARPSARLRP